MCQALFFFMNIYRVMEYVSSHSLVTTQDHLEWISEDKMLIKNAENNMFVTSYRTPDTLILYSYIYSKKNHGHVRHQPFRHKIENKTEILIKVYYMKNNVQIQWKIISPFSQWPFELFLLGILSEVGLPSSVHWLVSWGTEEGKGCLCTPGQPWLRGPDSLC